MTIWELLNAGVVVNLGDLPVLFRFNWHISSDNYVVTNSNGNKILLHRFITNAPEGAIVDHIDLNGLNNARDNLRVVDRTINRLNTENIGQGITIAPSGRYVARFTYKGQRINLGTFDNYEQALAVKREAVFRLTGETQLASLNEPNNSSHQ